MNLNKRIHAFDFIRSLAALWGVAFHAGFTYMATDPSPWLVVDPAPGSPLIDLLIWLSHRLRMPLFFLMSGFFACLVLEKKGINYFFKNRIKKILIPFLIASVIILPLIVELFGNPLISIAGIGFFQDIFNIQLQNPYTIRNFEQLQLAHLWFLYYLFLFSLCSIFLYKINFFTKIRLFISKNPIISRVTIIISLFLMHFSMDSLVKLNSTYYDLKINILAFIFYFSFFTWGFLLRDQNRLKALVDTNIKPFLMTTLLSAIITSGFIFLFQSNQYISYTLELSLIISLGTTLYCYAALFSILHLGLKLLKNGNSIINYLSDSSYWVYIVHVPVVILFQRSLYFWDIPLFLKWVIVSVFSYATLFLSYQILVRYTFIGEYLHGKREKTARKIILQA